MSKLFWGYSMIRKTLFLVILFSLFLHAQKIRPLHILFNQKSSTLNEVGKQKTIKHMEILKKQSLSKRGLQIQITGHMDMTPIEESVDSLALKRALAVEAFLLNELKVPKSLITIQTNLKEFKILPVTKEGQRLNRRVEIKVIKRVIPKKAAPRKMKVEVLSYFDATINNNQISEMKTIPFGDTLILGRNGTAQIKINDGALLTLNAGSKVTPSPKDLTLLEGSLVYQLPGNMTPTATLRAGDARLRSSGFATISYEDNTLRVAQYDGSTKVRFNKTETIVAKNYGYLKELDSNDGILLPLPEQVSLPSSLSFESVPGEPNRLSWDSPADSFRIQIEDTIQTHLDTVLSGNSLEYPLPYGELQYQIQAQNREGFSSLWSHTSTVSNKKISGITFASPVIAKDTIKVDSRFIPLSFTTHPLCSLSMSDIEFERVNDTLKTTHKLTKGLNLLYGVTHYPDSSVDTTEYYIHYSGHDERFTLNDTIMNLPAFTTTRKFILKGEFPTATSLKVNGEPIKLDNDGTFRHKLKLKSFKKHKTFLDVEFENGNKRRITRTIERKKIKSESEDALFKILGIAVTGGILFLVGFGIE